MATCPDRMVYWIGGSRSNTQYNSSHESKEYIIPKHSSVLIEHRSSVYLQLGNGDRSKRLSLVDEECGGGGVVIDHPRSTIVSAANSNCSDMSRRSTSAAAAVIHRQPPNEQLTTSTMVDFDIGDVDDVN